MRKKLKDRIKEKLEKKAREYMLNELDKDFEGECFRKAHQRSLITGESLEDALEHFKNYQFD